MKRKQLTTGRIFAICTGEFARAILSGIIVTYSLKFFNVTPSSGLPLLLPAGLMGALRSIGVVFDAITDPWVASLSDKHKGKNGRRIPFMRMAAIPYALTCLLIFFPPTGQVSTINIVWVIVMLLLYYLFGTFYNVPYLALQAEIVPDTKRRVFFYTINSLMFVLGSAVIFALPVIESSLTAGGMEPVLSWRIAIGIFVVMGAICAVIPAFAVKEQDYVDSKSYYKPIFQAMKATFAYKNFTIMTVGYLIMQFAFAFFNAALLFYVDILLGLNSGFATIVLGISIVVGIATYPVVNKLARTIGKKPLLLTACGTYVFIYLGIYFNEPLSRLISTKPLTNGFLLGFAGQGAITGDVVIAILIGLLIAFPIACTNIIPPSTFADMTQYDAIKTGENKAGMFIAARQFCTKLASALSALVVSYVMYLGAVDEYPTVVGVRTTALVAAIAIALALFVYSRYNDKDIVAFIDSHNQKLADQDAAQVLENTPVEMP